MKRYLAGADVGLDAKENKGGVARHTTETSRRSTMWAAAHAFRCSVGFDFSFAVSKAMFEELNIIDRRNVLHVVRQCRCGGGKLSVSEVFRCALFSWSSGCPPMFGFDGISRWTAVSHSSLG